MRRPLAGRQWCVVGGGPRYLTNLTLRFGVGGGLLATGRTGLAADGWMMDGVGTVQASVLCTRLRDETRSIDRSTFRQERAFFAYIGCTGGGWDVACRGC